MVQKYATPNDASRLRLVQHDSTTVTLSNTIQPALQRRFIWEGAAFVTPLWIYSAKSPPLEEEKKELQQ